ncbi:MAG: ThiF family adenylyltransferase [Devosia sp.]|nr:ThiF family adenylyltransferase [Devosia sp.]
MMPLTTLAMAGITHASLHRHLFPGDGKEAAAVLVCVPSPGPRDRLVVRHALTVPHEACSNRSPVSITWPGRYIEDAIDLAESEELVIVLLHSHPGGWLDFSWVDNESDARVLPGIFQAFGGRHGSAVMTPDGAVRARLYGPDMSIRPIDLVTVAGDDIHYWWNDGIIDGRLQTSAMAFTSGMTKQLARLSAAVIGVSGTGSIVAEQIARLGFGRVVLIDPDSVEGKNLNRILNSTTADAQDRRKKVEMFAAAIRSYRGADVPVALGTSIGERDAVQAVGRCDVIFSCVDSQEGRQIADLIAAAFVLPLFDVGVVIPTIDNDGVPEIIDVCGRIDYIQPGGSTLADRGVYTQEGLRAELLLQTDPDAYRDEVAEGYIKGFADEAPSVITLNMRAASAVVNEFIARTHRFRHDPNRLYARTRFSLAACDEDHYSEDSFQSGENGLLARGATEPLLGLPMLQLPRRRAA